MGKKKTTETKPVEETPKENLEDEILADLAELDDDISGSSPKAAAEPVEETEPEAPTEKSEEMAEEEGAEDDDFAEGLDDLPDDEVDNFDEVEEPAADEPEPVAEASSPEVALAEVKTEAAIPEKSEEELLKEATAEVEDELEEEEEKPTPKKGTALSPEQERLRKRNVIEAALFVAGKPLSVEDLNVKTEYKKKEIEELLKELMMDYMERSTSMEIVQLADKFVLQIKPEYTQEVKKFATGGAIPEAELKTLTIIALKQPILKSTLIKIRGAGAYDHIKALTNRGFIDAAKKGRSQDLVTTDLFADTFGLSRDISTLKKQLIAQLGIKPSADEGQ
jgi:segregation and condensation protein B